MKNFIHKMQTLSKKAADLKKAVEAAPAKAAELRNAVTMTASELHQLRSDVQASVSGLQADSEERLVQAMREINDAALVFEEAGYELTGLELDVAFNQRLTAHLEKFEDIESAAIRGMVARETRNTVKAILVGLLKAEETAANVELTYLHFQGVIVHIGAIPAIRICWRTEMKAEQASVVSTVQSSTPAPSPTLSGIGTLFAPHASATAPSATQHPALTSPTTVTQPSVSSHQPAQTSVSPWAASALDRFKKMPDLSKHRS